MKTILYCRVSTVDQTIAHQRAMAEAAGFEIDEVVSDNGVSGVATGSPSVRADGYSTCCGRATCLSSDG
jgi:DNA invertase Pin-like site-specific DNA recombinase